MTETLIMPANQEAERAVLGAVLLDDEVFPQAEQGLSPEQFSLDSHRQIYIAMRRLFESGKGIDTVTLTDELIKLHSIEAIGGVSYLSSLTDGLPRRENIEHYVQIVKDKAGRRQLIQACERGINAALDHTQDTNSCFDLVHDSLQAIEADSKKQPAKHVFQFSDAVFNDIERMREHKEELIGLSTGMRCLDLITTGIRAGELWVLGGRPGDGKSSIALQVASENVGRDIPVALFTIEMSQQQVLTRLWAQFGNIPFEKLRDPRRMNDSEFAHLRTVASSVAKMPLFVDESSSLSIREIVARARLLIKREKVRLIVVDYIQLVDAEGRDERQRISKISAALRELAKEGVPVLALSQLARPRDGALNTRPNKFSLKESGSLEADAHTVLLIYRPVDNHDQPTGEDEIIVAKQRNGPYSIEPVHFDSKALVYRERQMGTTNR